MFSLFPYLFPRFNCPECFLRLYCTTHNTNSRAPVAIRTGNLSRQASTDPCLLPPTGMDAWHKAEPKVRFRLLSTKTFSSDRTDGTILESSLLRCYVVQAGLQLSTRRTTVLPPCSVLSSPRKVWLSHIQDGKSTSLRNVGVYQSTQHNIL
jgi:hypothetical protein